jgi:hypothetical protein
VRALCVEPQRGRGGGATSETRCCRPSVCPQAREILDDDLPAPQRCGSGWNTALSNDHLRTNRDGFKSTAEMGDFGAEKPIQNRALQISEGHDNFFIFLKQILTAYNSTIKYLDRHMHAVTSSPTVPSVLYLCFHHLERAFHRRFGRLTVTCGP